MDYGIPLDALGNVHIKWSYIYGDMEKQSAHHTLGMWIERHKFIVISNDRQNAVSLCSDRTAN